MVMGGDEVEGVVGDGETKSKTKRMERKERMERAIHTWMMCGEEKKARARVLTCWS